MDYSGNKPLDYSRQRPSVSASTCSSEYQKYFVNTEVNNNYQLGFIETSLGRGETLIGGTLGSALTRGKKRSQMLYATVSGGSGGGGGAVSRSQSMMVQRRSKKPAVQGLFKSAGPGEDASDLVPCDLEGGHPVPFRGASTRRKESFLRKTFRSTAGGVGSRRQSKDVVTTNPPEHG